MPHSILSALLALAASDPEVGCGMPSLDLAEVPLTGETTYDRVLSAWGRPGAGGPANELATYYLSCDSRLWLSFEPKGLRRLTRAVRLDGSFVPRVTILFDSLEITKHRSCGQLRRGHRETGARIAAAWGPPDNEAGSGIVRWGYRMADGGHAQVFPLGGGRFMIGCARGPATAQNR
ncbi:hypothetical protein [Allosphingosinicella sp.]|uniref:hypothetical protein n=1 Tax=Allosphingosinicella sp. TaxID=2823234 RepID=UPI002F0FEC73